MRRVLCLVAIFAILGALTAFANEEDVAGGPHTPYEDVGSHEHEELNAKRRQRRSESIPTLPKDTLTAEQKAALLKNTCPVLDLLNPILVSHMEHLPEERAFFGIKESMKMLDDLYEQYDKKKGDLNCSELQEIVKYEPMLGHLLDISNVAAGSVEWKPINELRELVDASKQELVLEGRLSDEQVKEFEQIVSACEKFEHHVNEMTFALSNVENGGSETEQCQAAFQSFLTAASSIGDGDIPDWDAIHHGLKPLANLCAEVKAEGTEAKEDL